MLEGMGRAIETNLKAATEGAFACDALLLGMVRRGWAGTCHCCPPLCFAGARPTHASASASAQVKHPEVAECMRARLYDCVCRFVPAKAAPA